MSISSGPVGLVNRFLPQSFVDGPGNRAVIFFQGCNLHCQYCHNPFTIHWCNHCGVCVEHCPNGALSRLDGRVVWLPERCSECDTCIHACPNFSSPRVLSLSVEELWAKLSPVTPFISGVSVSGGEPALQMDFLADFFKIVGERSRLTRLIETNGYIGPDAYRPLLPYLDMALVDLKAIDPEKHHQLTGRNLSPVLNSIRFLWEQGKLYAVQQVIVPGFTDSDESAAATARFLAGMDSNIRLRFLRFRPHGTTGNALNWNSPSDEAMDRLVRTAQEQGLTQVSRSL